MIANITLPATSSLTIVAQNQGQAVLAPGFNLSCFSAVVTDEGGVTGNLTSTATTIGAAASDGGVTLGGSLGQTSITATDESVVTLENVGGPGLWPRLKGPRPGSNCYCHCLLLT